MSFLSSIGNKREKLPIFLFSYSWRRCSRRNNLIFSILIILNRPVKYDLMMKYTNLFTNSSLRVSFVLTFLCLLLKFEKLLLLLIRLLPNELPFNKVFSGIVSFLPVLCKLYRRFLASVFSAIFDLSRSDALRKNKLKKLNKKLQINLIK